ncbi:hypothetical protein AVEN_214969-1 [Araneus ventricosus]|uniref:Uncharacterized protein n=1 Tax=Araneus ventricosus TaxID=182803 RepID=A0A4Y2M9U9_ARAVE|nr:hypothetical protein AVEN_214969-1 [Araneus ventricosus]
MIFCCHGETGFRNWPLFRKIFFYDVISKLLPVFQQNTFQSGKTLQYCYALEVASQQCCSLMVGKRFLQETMYGIPEGEWSQSTTVTHFGDVKFRRLCDKCGS